MFEDPSERLLFLELECSYSFLSNKCEKNSSNPFRLQGDAHIYIHTHTYVRVLISLWLFPFPIFLPAAQPKEFFLDGLKKLEQRSHKCVELRGEYEE
jgi:hypothetical protein